MIKIIAALLVLSGSLSFGAVKVAFFEARDSQGKLVTMESGGRFIHVAISVGDKWLHAHPYWGVQLVDSLNGIGNPVMILTNESINDLKEEDIKKYLHQKYDSSYSWEAQDKTYCSKLIAQILNLPPSAMMFSGSIWKIQKVSAIQELGISPDDVYHELQARGFHSWGNRCENVFIQK